MILNIKINNHLTELLGEYFVMNKIIRFVLYIYIFVSSWTLAYKVGEWFTVPNLIVLLAVILYFFRSLLQKRLTITLYHEDIFLILSVCSMIISYAINHGNINYIVAYCFVYIVLYIFMRQIYFDLCSTDDMLKINSISIVFVSSFIISEFLWNYLFKINLREILHFGQVPEASYMTIYSRSYGFSTEPTNLGYYLNALGPIGIWYIYNKMNISKFLKILLILICCFGWFTTFSTATFSSMLLSCLILFALNFGRIMKKKRARKKFLLAIICGLLLLIGASVGFLKNYNTVAVLIEPIINKISVYNIVDNPEKAFSSRYYRWARDFERFKLKPIAGYGPGNSTILFGSSSINWYLTTLVETGLISIIPTVLFLGISFSKIRRSKIESENVILLSFISSAIHLFSFTAFYDPAVWLLLIFFHHSARTCKANIE